MTEQTYRNRMLGALWGAVVGDALGVPVEFVGRDKLRRQPVADMIGYGSHGQPPGTWSDDSSLLLCTVESLLGGWDTEDLGKRFVRWLAEADWTPYGEVFDVGVATSAALRRIIQRVPAEQAGGNDESNNGNGSLMRILPIALDYAYAPTAELLSYAHRASSVTHRHLRSQLACGLYCVMITELLGGCEPLEAYQQTIESARVHYRSLPHAAELPHFDRILSGHLWELPESEIRSSGYVVNTLEASLWCFVTTDSYEAAVLKAVNLGEDTDTTGTVTGGLAGTYYGCTAIPIRWIEKLARRNDLEQLFDQFVDRCAPLNDLPRTR